MIEVLSNLSLFLGYVIKTAATTFVGIMGCYCLLLLLFSFKDKIK